MTSWIKATAGVLLVLVGLVMLNVSSPNYAVVLSISTASFVGAATLFELSARSASGQAIVVFRIGFAIAIVLGGYAAWGALGAL